MSEIVHQKNRPVVVAGHICVDVIPSFPASARMPDPGQLTEVGPAVISTGGAVANTGLALHKLGVPVRLVALAGNDFFGRGLKELLKSSGAETRLKIRPDVATSYSIVLSPPATDRSFLHSPAANHDFSPDDVTDLDLQGTSALHFGYPQTMRRTFQDGGKALAGLFQRASSRGLLTSLDTCCPDPTSAAGKTDWIAFFRTVLPHVSIFCPSIDELPALMGLPSDMDVISEVHIIAVKLINLGAAAVAIKLGHEGLYLRTTNDPHRLQRSGLSSNWLARELRSPCFLATVVSSTGSGDCTIAGLLAAVLRGCAPEEALTYATAVGAFSVEAHDATGGIRPWNDVSARIAAGWPRRPSRPQRPGYVTLAHDVVAGPDDTPKRAGETK